VLFGQDGGGRPSGVRASFAAARDCYFRGDYEGAAKLFIQVQINQGELTLQEQRDLQELVGNNNRAQQARREGAEKLARAEDLLRQGNSKEAGELIRALQAHQYLTPADKQRVALLGNQLRVVPPVAPAPQPGAQPPVSKEDPKTLLSMARAAMQRNDLDAAERYAKQAEAGNKDFFPAWMHPWDDNPGKVLGDVQAARAKQAAALQPPPPPKQDAPSPLMAPINAVKNLFGQQPAPAARSGDQATTGAVTPNAPPAAARPDDANRTQVATRTNASPVPAVQPPTLAPTTPNTVAAPAVTTPAAPKPAPGRQVVNPETVAARKNLELARQALTANDLAKAQTLVLQVKAMKGARLEWWDEQPDKMLAEIASRAGTPGAPKVNPAVASNNAPTPPVSTSNQKDSSDPRLLLRQGRELFHQKKLDEADKLSARAASIPTHWGLFEDSPEKLRQDIQGERAHLGRDEAGKLMAEARQAFQKGDAVSLQEAKTKAFRARQLHGTYYIWDLGDRPDNLLRDVEVAEANLRKSGTNVAQNNPNPNANKNEPAAPQASLAATDARNKARFLLVEARALEKQGKLADAGVKASEAQKFALEAQKGGAAFGPGEDTPAQALALLGVACKNRVNNLLQTAEDTALRGQDPARYQRAGAALTEARQLAMAFRCDTADIDQKVDWLRRLSQGLPTGAVPPPPVGVAQNNVVPPPPAPVGTNDKADYMRQMQQPGGTVAQADPRKQGFDLLEKSRLEMRCGNSRQARMIAEEAFRPEYGVQNEAAAMLRSIDTEEFAQKGLAMNRNFDSALLAFGEQRYKQAYIGILALDDRLLSPDRQARLRELMASKEMQAEAAAAPRTGDAENIARVGAQDSGKPGNIIPPNLVGVREPVGPGVNKNTDAAMAEHKAMEKIRYDKLTADRFEVERRAMAAARASDYVTALDVLRTFDATLQDANLSPEKLANLRRAIERRMAEYKTLKAQDELTQASSKRNNIVIDGNAEEKQRLKEKSEKENQIADIMKQYNKFYREGNFRAAELVARKGLDIDYDNLALKAAIMQASSAKAKEDDRKITENIDDWFNENGRSDNMGPVVNTRNPVEFDKDIYGRARNRQNLEFIPNKVRSSRERDIERKLLNPVTLNYKDAPLRDVLDSLGSMTNTNIVADKTALQEADIDSEKALLSLKVEGISLKSALNILLRQAKLTYVIQNEVLMVTTEEHAKGKLKIVTYPVADLVVPVENYKLPAVADFYKTMARQVQPPPAYGSGPTPMLMPYSLKSGDQVSSMSGGVPQGSNFGTAREDLGQTNFGQAGTREQRPPGATLEDLLMRLITSTVEPNSWSEVGGKGTIQYFPLGLALVVNQTGSIQEDIQDLLAALRRLQDLEVAIEMRLVSVSESFFERIGVDFDINITNNNVRFEPQLVTQQFQPAGFINANRFQNFFSGLTPAGTFTPDLGVPLKSSSFDFSLPPFGGFPGTLGADGGLSLGLAFLSDIQVFMFMEAAQGDRRYNVMQAPKITVFNGQNAFINVADAQFFLTQINVVPFGSQLVFQPQNQPLFFQVALNVTPVVSADRRFVRLNLQPQLTNLASANVPLVPVQIPVNDLFQDNIVSTQPKIFQTFFQQPAVSTISLNTTVVIPDGGTVLMGGLKTLSEGRNEFGPPILSKIPYLNRLFKNVGYGRESQSLMVMVTARIIINEEEEQIFLGNLPPIPR
jgi:type II secretory pathway component GspD/PulD (secretin)